jgi:uncharacterized protein YbcI
MASFDRGAFCLTKGRRKMSDEHPGGGRLAAAISNAVVRHIAETTGRGPTKARTTIGQDSIFVVVQDTLTRGERVLVEAGDASVVLRMREAWQHAMHAGLNQEVEQLTGRTVIGFMRSNCIEPDLGVEVFILEPNDADGRFAEGDST